MNMTDWLLKQTLSSASADVFAVPPTVGLNPRAENNDPGDPSIRKFFRMAMDMQRGIYEPSCRVFAPFYRQVTVPVYGLDETEAAPYFELAYSDVRMAFLEYFNDYNCGRPFFLWGFSQGADMCLRLMKDIFGEEKYRKNFVACYAIGWRLTSDEVRAYPQLVPAQGEDDTGVVVCFNSETAGVRGSITVPEGIRSVCINPVSWKTAGHTDKSLNPGSRFFDLMTGKETGSETGSCAVTVNPDRGTLCIDGFDPEDGDILGLGKGVLHLYDYMLFYESLKRNIPCRLEAFLERNGIPKQNRCI